MSLTARGHASASTQIFMLPAAFRFRMSMPCRAARGSGAVKPGSATHARPRGSVCGPVHEQRGTDMKRVASKKSAAKKAVKKAGAKKAAARKVAKKAAKKVARSPARAATKKAVKKV